MRTGSTARSATARFRFTFWVGGFDVLGARAWHNVAWILNDMEDRVEEEDTAGRTASVLRKLGEQESQGLFESHRWLSCCESRRGLYFGCLTPYPYYAPVGSYQRSS